MNWFLFAIGSAILSGASAVISKRALSKENAVEFSTALALTVVIVSLPLILWLNIDLPLFLWVLIIFMASTAAAGFLFIAKALRNMDISIVSPLRNFEPVFIAIFAFALLGEVLNWMHVLGILAIITGSYVLEIDFGKHSVLMPFKEMINSKYIHYVFISLLFYSFSAISLKYALDFAQPITLVFLNQFFVAIIFLIYISVEHGGLKDVKEGFNRAGWLILIIGILTVSYRLLQYNAMHIQYVSLVIPIKRMDSLFSTVIGGEIFHEHSLIHRTIACIIMILGASLVILG